MNGVERIAAERKRQIEKEKWTATHDDYYENEQLARAAVCYALPIDIKTIYIGSLFQKQSLLNELWPFAKYYYKPTPENRIRELEKAGALIAAEIDRLLRKEEAK
jgi:hypothetical protein